MRSLLSESSGKVYLVGAGPGHSAYLTVRGQHLLAQADVLVCDALIDEDLLQHIPSTCQIFEVGKRGGQPSTSQADINQLLVQQCQKDKQVVRLKSGDPFIFGRCTEEIQALQKAGCSFEVVPGISSALAAPLLAGIPLTDPVLSRGFAVFTGHEPDALDWEALVQLETLVFLMATRTLPDIVERLQRHGRSANTPVAIIRRAGQVQQQVWVSDLGRVLQDTAGARLSPSVIVIGEVVRLRPYLEPPDPPLAPMVSVEPLSQKTILVTRSVGQSRQFCDRLEQAGARVVEMPALEIGPPTSWAPLDRAIDDLRSFDWLVLTSTNGVDYFFERLIAKGYDARSLADLKIAVVGKKTAKSLTDRSVQPDFIPPDFVADSLVENFPVHDLRGYRILFPRVESGGREVLVNQFRDRGSEVIEVPAYESRCPDAIPADALRAIQQGQLDVITFASSKTVQNFCYLIESTPGLSLQDPWLDTVCIASIGPQTSYACEDLLGRVDVEAQEYTLDGLLQAIEDWAQAVPQRS